MNITFTILTALSMWKNTHSGYGHSLDTQMDAQERIAAVCGIKLDIPSRRITQASQVSMVNAIGDCMLYNPTYATAATFYAAVRDGKTETALMFMPVNVDNASDMSDTALINAGMVALTRCPLDQLYTKFLLSELNCSVGYPTTV